MFQHGASLEDVWPAHTLALQAVEFGFAPAKWLAAASLDRWLMYQGYPQKYRAQCVPDGKQYRLWEVDPSTTEADRAAWDVPSWDEQARHAQQMTRSTAQPSMDDAPWWLKEAVSRWNQ